MNRRGFLGSIAKIAGGAAVAQVDGIAGLIDTVTGSSGSARLSALKTLLIKRNALMVGGSEESDDMLELWTGYNDEIDALRAQHLGPLQYDSSLLTPTEAKAFQADLGKLKLDYTARYKKLEAEVTQIDGTLRQYPDEVRKLVEPSVKYQEKLDSFANLPEHVRDARIAQLPEPPLIEIDPSVLEDAQAMADGARANLSSSYADDFKTTIGDVDTISREVGRALRPSKSKDWEQKRHEALMESVIDLLEKLANTPEVRIESSLTRGYGRDNWTISTQMHHDQIGEDHDQELMGTFTLLQEILKKAYPERFKDEAEPFLQHGRPLQSGYGEHDCERLRILGPSFELRELLKEAETENMVMRNGESPNSSLAR